MEKDRQCQASPIETLSVELVHLILSAVPDVESLRAAVLSCPLFYGCFLEAEASTTALVLRNQIDDSVLPEAMAAAASLQLRPHGAQQNDKDAVEHFVANSLRRTLSLRDALLLGRLHIYVDRWATKFVTAALGQDALHKSQPGLAATYQEICRIERALYRNEIYCNLFREVPTKQSITSLTRTTPSILYAEQKELFFANFARWENEQLGCIHDFLARAVSPSFDDVAEHDISWGVSCVPYGVGVGSPPLEHVLSWGLARLYHLTEAETYEERYRLLDAGRNPAPTYSFLYEGLQMAANEYDSIVFYDDIQPEDEARYFHTPFFADPDTGPADVWRWAHIDESWQNWVYQEDRSHLRRWAYVLWDRARLEATGIFETPMENLIRSREE
ncbi:hypothetical protein HMPREF1624_08489 [Sporothrix schenckii ATCC 58251]|uniref:F-box domain-containing protein n=1 Tax=Sporothrix schenckii (strain ATCC 58251 / de Perez 2211183) TaxID=1391915 RepID=U7PIA8_SPOS1|nr:hypothetical protein HMPREF1624_08489 [Sporothrix schenckii ATCC 58251]